MKKFALLLAFVLLLPICVSAQEIPVLDNTGLKKIIAENKGKVIMLNFFATWCPPCRVELPELVKLRKNYPEKQFLLIGLSLDEDKTAVGPFIKLAEVNYPVYMADSSITDAFKISSVPHNTFITKKGEVVISEPGIADVDVLKKVVDELLAEK